MLRSSQAWTDGAARFLQDYVAESQDAAAATERALPGAFAGAEDALVSFATKDGHGPTSSRHACKFIRHDVAIFHVGTAIHCRDRK
jgi:hypothetical protein